MAFNYCILNETKKKSFSNFIEKPKLIRNLLNKLIFITDDVA